MVSSVNPEPVMVKFPPNLLIPAGETPEIVIIKFPANPPANPASPLTTTKV